MTTTAPVRRTLLEPAQPNEKCDAACPANALVAVLMPSNQRLVFCGHHYDSQSPLHRIEILVIDSRKV